MGEKTLKFGKFKVNKKDSYASKKPIALNFVDTDKVVVSDKFKHNEKASKYFNGYLDDNIVRILCIVLPQMSGYIKYFDNGRKNISFEIKNEKTLANK